MNARCPGRRAAVLFATVLFAAGCTHSSRSASEPGDPPRQENSVGWVSLSDDMKLGQWRGYESATIPDGWREVDGTITKEGAVGDLITRQLFSDFELELEWKIGEGGNSGIFYRGTHAYDHIYWSAPEYQLLDDANASDGRNRLTAAAAAYGLYAGPADLVKPFGEWNSTRILVKGAHVEHWLNGRKAVDYELWSPQWRTQVAASKFSAYPDYGLATSGFIGIQGDHRGSLALRHVRIRELR